MLLGSEVVLWHKMTQTNISFRNYHQFTFVGFSGRHNRTQKGYTASIIVILYIHRIVKFNSKFLVIRRAEISEWIFVSLKFSRD